MNDETEPGGKPWEGRGGPARASDLQTNVPRVFAGEILIGRRPLPFSQLKASPKETTQEEDSRNESGLGSTPAGFGH